MASRRTVILVGAGQLGSRYLQGMAAAREPLDIQVVDPSDQSLARADERWFEVADSATIHTVKFSRDLESMPQTADIAIIATSAAARAVVAEQLNARCQVGLWVLEKVLAQSSEDIETIERAVQGSRGAWVNTPMHMWSLYRNLRTECPGKDPISAAYEDVRGLACNAIHYVDFVARWNNALPVTVVTDGLEQNWYPSERPGYHDVYGRLTVHFEDGSELLVTSKEKDRQFRSALRIGPTYWEVNERGGMALAEDGRKVEGECAFQSQLTGDLIDGLLSNGSCALPTLEEAALQHRVYLEALLTHWNRTMDRSDSRLPIT